VRDAPGDEGSWTIAGDYGGEGWRDQTLKWPSEKSSAAGQLFGLCAAELQTVEKANGREDLVLRGRGLRREFGLSESPDEAKKQLGLNDGLEQQGVGMADAHGPQRLRGLGIVCHKHPGNAGVASLDNGQKCQGFIGTKTSVDNHCVQREPFYNIPRRQRRIGVKHPIPCSTKHAHHHLALNGISI